MRDSFRAHGALRRLLAFLHVGRGPDRVERLVEAKPRVDVPRELVGLGDDRFQSRSNEGVAVRLTTRQGTGVAAKKWQVWGKFLAKGHGG
jgi:hypothetical protein